MTAVTEKCIYCKRSGVESAREHVIPRAFGTFGPGTMVLTREVCVNCNHMFGKQLDQILARDTRESLIRAQVLPPHRLKKDRFKAKRILIRVPDEAKFGYYRGARMAISWETRKLRPVDQVIVRDEQGKLHSFIEDEMSSADEKLFQNRPAGSTQVIGTQPGVGRLMKLVVSKGGRFTDEPTNVEPPPAANEPNVYFEVEGLIDDAVYRSVAKIAFNYLTKIEGAAYVLDDKFDYIREFIKGNVVDRALVQFSRRPILADDSPGSWREQVHLVMFERLKYGLLGRVSLFNSFTYDVRLCRDLGLLYPLKSGHAFDPFNKTVHKLTGISRRIKIL